MQTSTTPRRHSAVRAAVALAVTGAALALLAAPAVARSSRPRPTYRPAAAPTPSTDSNTPDQRRTITVSGVAKVRGTPDLLTMTLGVSSRGRSVGEALDRNNAAIQKVMDVLADGGVDKKDIQTTNFAIGPVRDDKSTITGYSVSNLLTVQLRDLAKAGGIIDKSATAGGDDVVMNGVSFTFDDASDLVAQARAEAVKRARAQADELARAAGVELGDVLTISESTPDQGPILSAPSERAAGADVAIEPGTEELSVQV